MAAMPRLHPPSSKPPRMGAQGPQGCPDPEDREDYGVLKEKIPPAQAGGVPREVLGTLCHPFPCHCAQRGVGTLSPQDTRLGTEWGRGSLGAAPWAQGRLRADPSGCLAAPITGTSHHQSPPRCWHQPHADPSSTHPSFTRSCLSPCIEVSPHKTHPPAATRPPTSPRAHPGMVTAPRSLPPHQLLPHTPPWVPSHTGGWEEGP